MIIDLHVHSDLSPCSDLNIQNIIQYSKKIGLDGVCITDHHTMAARSVIKNGIQSNGLLVITGLEYSTPDGDFLLFGSVDNLDNIQTGLTARELLDIVSKKDDCIAIAAHPCRADRPLKEYVLTEGLCRIIEVENGRNTCTENMTAKHWVTLYSLVECGGSDAHTCREIGQAVTRFTIPIRNQDDFISALKEGLCKSERRVFK